MALLVTLLVDAEYFALRDFFLLQSRSPILLAAALRDRGGPSEGHHVRLGGSALAHCGVPLTIGNAAALLKQSDVGAYSVRVHVFGAVPAAPGVGLSEEEVILANALCRVVRPR